MSWAGFHECFFFDEESQLSTIVWKSSKIEQTYPCAMSCFKKRSTSTVPENGIEHGGFCLEHHLLGL
jgi:hypothetical protein